MCCGNYRSSTHTTSNSKNLAKDLAGVAFILAAFGMASTDLIISSKYGERIEMTGDFCTSRSEREFTLKECWYAKYGRYGYRRITVLLQARGWSVGKD